VRLLKVQATESGVYALYRCERPAPNTEDATACVQGELLRFDIPPALDASRLVKPSATRGPVIPPGLLDTAWTDRCVVFVAVKGLLAWELP
jgi:hypothetical protein